MNYKQVLDRLIEHARTRARPLGYVERHHIVPRAFGGSNEPNNIVILTAREHFVAHRLLAKIHPDTGMVHAVYKMACTAATKGKNVKFTSSTYALLREAHAAKVGPMLKKINAEYVERHGHGSSKGVKKSAEHCLKISRVASARTGSKNSFYGKQHRPDTIDTIRKKAIGRKCSTLRPFTIDGVRYERLKDAEAATGIKCTTIWHRCVSPNPKFISYCFTGDQ